MRVPSLHSLCKVAGMRVFSRFSVLPALCLACLGLTHHKAAAQGTFSSVRGALPKVLVKDRIRVFYDTQGVHAVTVADANQNGVPDQVEDIATQTTSAWMLLIDGLGFPDPFKGERFEKAAFLDVNLLSKDALKSNGITYDEMQRFNRPADPAGTLSLCFDVATPVHADTNLTPAHELFHVIQNGVTYFKNRWYSEGTARWSEAALGPGPAGSGKMGLRGSWPPDDARLKAIFEMSYDAAPQFWEPMAMALDKQGKIPAQRLPAALNDMRYVNGDPVLKDLDLSGWEIIRDVLVELGKVDDVAFKELSLQRWSEEAQKSPANLPYIYKAVTEVAKRKP